MPKIERNSVFFSAFALPEQNEIKITFVIVVHDEKTSNDFLKIGRLMTVKTEMAWNFIYSRFLSSLSHNFRLIQMYPSVFSTPGKGIKVRQIPSSLSVEVYYMEKII